MSPPLFPPPIGTAWPVKRAQNWSAAKQDALSGKRTRTSLYTYPTYSYELTINFMRSTQALQEWQQLSDFISRLFGPTQLFAYSDPNDGAVANQLFAVGDGVTQSFQLVRTLFTFNEPVFLTNNPSIFVNGVLKTPAVDYVISATSNLAFAVAPPPGAALTWTGTFYWPCRFDDDSTNFANFLQNLFELKSLKFSTEKIDTIFAVAPPNPTTLETNTNFLGRFRAPAVPTRFNYQA